MAISILLMIQRTVRLPNIKVSTILLSLAFVYDIFWVFISPFLFTTSVMQEVALGGSSGEPMPMLVRIPRLTDLLGGDSMLGLGDMALPGLLVSFLLRYDYTKGNGWAASYFLLAMCGYWVGFVLTVIALVTMETGQPALLYLVPCTLYFVLLVAWWRGHVRDLWEGTGMPQSAPNRTSHTGELTRTATAAAAAPAHASAHAHAAPRAAAGASSLADESTALLRGVP
jgi:signal peptide peptidase-like 2B